LNTFKSELQYANPFWNVSLPHEGHFANFAQNWLPLTSLEKLEKGSRSIIYNEMPTIYEKL